MDLYQQLGLKRGASADEIKKAYRSLAKQLHPDRNKDNPNAAERFGKVTQAYDILSDKDKRAQYDRGEIDEEGNQKSPFGGGFGGGGGSPFGQGAGRAHGFPGGGQQQGFEEADLSDLFEGLFRGQQQQQQRQSRGPFGRRAEPPRKGADTNYRLTVPFIDAARLETQRVKLSDGSTLDMKLPAGVEDGTKVRLAGKGDPGPAGRGDAIVSVKISPHKHFVRDGSDIRLDLPISLKEAVEGAKVKVPTVDGAVTMTVPKGTSGGTVMRLKGKGFSKRTGGRGDQLVTLEIAIPKDDAALASFVANWSHPGNVREGLGA